MVSRRNVRRPVSRHVSVQSPIACPKHLAHAAGAEVAIMMRYWLSWVPIIAFVGPSNTHGMIAVAAETPGLSAGSWPLCSL